MSCMMLSALSCSIWLSSLLQAGLPLPVSTSCLTDKSFALHRFGNASKSLLEDLALEVRSTGPGPLTTWWHHQGAGHDICLCYSAVRSGTLPPQFLLITCNSPSYISRTASMRSPGCLAWTFSSLGPGERGL